MNFPKQLENKKIRFTYLEPNDKKPIGLEWQKEGGSNYDYITIQDMLQRSPENNYGVLCGTGRLLVIDADKKGYEEGFKVLVKTIDEAQQKGTLPKTFAVQTQSGGMHIYYYISEETEHLAKFYDMQYKVDGDTEKHIGEIRWKNKKGTYTNIVGCGSKVNGNEYKLIQDYDIAEISWNTLFGVLKEFIDEKELIKTAETEAIKNIKKIDGQGLNLLIEEVIDISQYSKDGEEYYGEHPIHGSDTGKNFWFNLNKQLWFCFRHNIGGNALHLFAMKQGLINCEEVGELKGNKFIAVLELARQEFNRNVLPRENEDITSNINKAILGFANYFEMADKFLKIQPLYYNEKKFWWAWSQQETCWKIIDDTDILNAIHQKVHGLKLFESKQKNEILTALQMRARLLKPQEAPDHWIQFKDKIFDYKTGEFIKATAEHFVTNPIPFEIGESEDTPTLDKWFAEWVGEKWVPTLYELIAYSCIPNYKINRIFCLNGEGRNGKSTLLHIMRNFVGEKNCCSSSMDILLSRTFEAAKLYKKLLCEMGEINAGIFRKTELIKKLVGTDTIGFEFKGKDGFDGYNYAKIVIATNKLPETTDKTTGFYSKWIIIDFYNRFKENPNFLDGLPEIEYNNLAKKCCRIIKELMDRGSFTNEGSPEEKQARYEEKSSPFNDFFKLEMDKDDSQETPFFLIYKEYVSYCGQRNLRIPSKVEVGRILRAKGFVPTTVRFTLSNGQDTTVQAYKGLFFIEEKDGSPDDKEVGLRAYESV